MNARPIPVLICLLLLGALAPGADREAERAYRDGRRLQRDGKLREAFEAYKRAADREPRDQRFVVAREMTRQQAAFAYVNAGERLMRAGRYADAIPEFEQAADLDPSNDFTQRELKRAREAVKAGRRQPQGLAEALPDERFLPPPLALRPRRGVHSWNLKGTRRSAPNTASSSCSTTTSPPCRRACAWMTRISQPRRAPFRPSPRRSWRRSPSRWPWWPLTFRPSAWSWSAW
jgi:tetratricopeptide (TPR) repeat protein